MSAAKGAKADHGRNELIRVGAPTTVLATIFNCDTVKVKRVIAQNNIQPTITADNRELYAIRDVAPFLVDLTSQVDVEDLIKNVSIRKLPPELSKVFWEAANAKRKFMEEDGQLWRTEAVMEVFLDCFKTIRESVNNFSDGIDDRVELTPRQREIMQSMCDGLLGSVREKLIDTFSLYVPNEPEKDVEVEEFRKDG